VLKGVGYAEFLLSTGLQLRISLGSGMPKHPKVVPINAAKPMQIAVISRHKYRKFLSVWNSGLSGKR